MSAILKKHYKSLFPSLYIKHHDETVAMKNVYSYTHAVDNGCKQAQIFVGAETIFTYIYGMKIDSQFVNTLEDCIRDREAMSELVSNSAQVEISKRVLYILRSLCIGDWQSEPHQQHQNPAERRYQTVN